MRGSRLCRRQPARGDIGHKHRQAGDCAVRRDDGAVPVFIEFPQLGRVAIFFHQQQVFAFQCAVKIGFSLGAISRVGDDLQHIQADENLPAPDPFDRRPVSRGELGVAVIPIEGENDDANRTRHNGLKQGGLLLGELRGLPQFVAALCAEGDVLFDGDEVGDRAAVVGDRVIVISSVYRMSAPVQTLPAVIVAHICR